MTMSMSKEKKEDLSISEQAGMMEKLKTFPEFVHYVNIVSKLRDEAHWSVMCADCENAKYRERLRSLDEVIGIPDEIIKRARAFESQQGEES